VTVAPSPLATVEAAFELIGRQGRVSDMRSETQKTWRSNDG
jgi:hypothetical protein